MSQLKDKLYSTLFEGRNFLDLGVARVIFFFYLFDYFNSSHKLNTFLKFKDVPEFFWQPVSLFKFLPFLNISSISNEYVFYGMLVSFIFSGLGLFSRLFIPLSFVFGFLHIGLPNNFGTIFDSTCLVVVSLGILAFSNAGEILSVDSLIYKNKKVDRNKANWCLNLITFSVLVFYFFSGVQKLRINGLNFFEVEHLAIGMITNGAEFGTYLVENNLISGTMILFAVLLQLSSLVPIAFKRLIPYFLFAHMCFHLFIDLSMTNHFSLLKILYVFMVPWMKIISNVQKIFNINSINASLSSRNHHKSKAKELSKELSITFLIILFSTFSVYRFEHIWPFSTATMYAFVDNFPYSEKEVYLERGDTLKKLTNDDLSPVGVTKTRITLLKKVTTPSSEIKSSLLKLIDINTDSKFDRLIIKNCLYPDLYSLISTYPNSKNCEEITSYEILNKD